MTLRPRTAAAVCLALTAAALFPTLRNGFTNWDDPQYILENPLVRSLSPGSVLAMFTTPEYAGMYDPVTLLAIAVQRAIFGTAPFGYHLVSLLLHLGVTLLVLRLALRLTGSPAASLCSALLFGVHPLHVEPVGWIADQKDLLYSLFYLGAVLGYLKYREGGGSKDLYLRVFPLFILSSLSKAVAVTLPVVLLILDYRGDGRINGRALREKIPFLAVSIVIGIAAIAAQSAAGALAGEGTGTPVEVFLNASRGFALYAARTISPIGLSPWYPYPREIPLSFWIYPVLSAGLLAAAFASRRSHPLVFTGIAWYTVTVAPVLQVVQVGGAAMADRFAYLPSVGLLLIVGWAFALARERLAPSKRAASALLAAGAVYTLILASASFSLLGVWRDGTTLWGRVIERYPDSPKGWFNRGQALHALGKYGDAVSDYDRAIAIAPSYPYALSNRGISRFLMGEREGALADFDGELRARPSDPDVLFWRGSVLASLARYPEAAADFTAVLSLRPGDLAATVRRALVYSSMRDYPRAEADFDVAIALRPGQPDLHFNRGNVRAGMEKWDAAIADYSAVIRMSPGDGDAFYARGIASFLRGDTAAACGDLRRALALGAARAETTLAEICVK